MTLLLLLGCSATEERVERAEREEVVDDASLMTATPSSAL